MIFDASVAMTWILFIALFPMSFFWLRRAYRIFIKKDYSDVAVKRGVAPEKPHRWAPVVGFLNLAAGLFALYTVYCVLGLGYPYDSWSAMAGTLIWSKIIMDFLIRQQAHPIKFGRKKKEEAVSA